MIVAIFQDHPKEYHFTSVKRIFRYLKETSDYGIWYVKSSNFSLCAYIDVDFEGNIDERKSTRGGAFFLGGRLVSWLSKKQDCISQSAIEVEYVAVENKCNQVMWMKQMLEIS